MPHVHELVCFAQMLSARIWQFYGTPFTSAAEADLIWFPPPSETNVVLPSKKGGSEVRVDGQCDELRVNEGHADPVIGDEVPAYAPNLGNLVHQLRNVTLADQTWNPYTKPGVS